MKRLALTGYGWSTLRSSSVAFGVYRFPLATFVRQQGPHHGHFLEWLIESQDKPSRHLISCTTKSAMPPLLNVNAAQPVPAPPVFLDDQSCEQPETFYCFNPTSPLFSHSGSLLSPMIGLSSSHVVLIPFSYALTSSQYAAVRSLNQPGLAGSYLH